MKQKEILQVDDMNITDAEKETIKKLIKKLNLSPNNSFWSHDTAEKKLARKCGIIKTSEETNDYTMTLHDDYIDEDLQTIKREKLKDDMLLQLHQGRTIHQYMYNEDEMLKEVLDEIGEFHTVYKTYTLKKEDEIYKERAKKLVKEALIKDLRHHGRIYGNYLNEFQKEILNEIATQKGDYWFLNNLVIDGDNLNPKCPDHLLEKCGTGVWIMHSQDKNRLTRYLGKEVVAAYTENSWGVAFIIKGKVKPFAYIAFKIQEFNGYQAQGIKLSSFFKLLERGEKNGDIIWKDEEKLKQINAKRMLTALEK